ncbi:MAG: ATP-binding protein [Myxococcota bacterium]
MDPILGNELVRARLWKAADEDRLHHCYLFEGPAGVGKATTARRLALYVNCEAPPPMLGPPPPRPCGECRSCRLILAGTHPDVITVVPDPEKSGRVITAEQAREVIAALQLQRHSARRRFVILDPADALNEESANALLKTLEEPAAGTQFVLVTARAAALLQTVRSRSQRVRFGPVSREETVAWLVGRGLDPRLAVDAQGSPGLALRLAEGEAAERAAVADAVVAVAGQPLHKLFALTEPAGKREDGGNEKAERVVDAVEALVRDAALLHLGRADGVLHEAHAPALRRWGAAMWPGGVARMQRAVADARDRLRLHVNGRTVLDALMAALNQELSRVS